ncbi:hypothetical protein GCM10007916_00850 [Psychromonas marina]|uniref:Uncharacterized protein n=1 Tax=Psychromonas marina TaxID=88364 RepID=A0ABQ6DVI2_9GAMM|nr:hypothetical protein [Psychromonas marina]GLS89018.1 hypothetical protein GCM10007916_00850 [Psychromonas marina]
MFDLLVIFIISMVMLSITIHYKKSAPLKWFGLVMLIGGSSLLISNLVVESTDDSIVINLIFSMAIGLLCWLKAMKMKE